MHRKHAIRFIITLSILVVVIVIIHLVGASDAITGMKAHMGM